MQSETMKTVQPKVKPGEANPAKGKPTETPMLYERPKAKDHAVRTRQNLESENSLVVFLFR